MSPKTAQPAKAPAQRTLVRVSPNVPASTAPALTSSCSLWSLGAVTNTGYRHELMLLFNFQATLQVQQAFELGRELIVPPKNHFKTAEEEPSCGL